MKYVSKSFTLSFLDRLYSLFIKPVVPGDPILPVKLIHERQAGLSTVTSTRPLEAKFHKIKNCFNCRHLGVY